MACDSSIWFGTLRVLFMVSVSLLWPALVSMTAWFRFAFVWNAGTWSGLACGDARALRRRSCPRLTCLGKQRQRPSRSAVEQSHAVSFRVVLGILWTLSAAVRSSQTDYALCITPWSYSIHLLVVFLFQESSQDNILGLVHIVLYRLNLFDCPRSFASRTPPRARRRIAARPSRGDRRRAPPHFGPRATRHARVSRELRPLHPRFDKAVAEKGFLLRLPKGIYIYIYI